MRKTLLAGNWKMNKTKEEALSFIQQLTKEDIGEFVEVLICPPALYLEVFAGATNETPIAIGVQNIYHKDSGAFTGEISAPMVKEIGATHVIIGHSERREIFSETDNDVQQKTKASLTHGLTPIVCCGESVKEFKLGITDEIITKQIQIALEGLTAEEAKQLVIAYEPIWAIGTGEVATPAIANHVCATIRKTIATAFSKEVADGIRILYGGSVNANNIKELLDQTHIDGALVGGASLEVDSFVKLIKNSQKK